MVLGFEDGESYRKSSMTLGKSTNEEQEKPHAMHMGEKRKLYVIPNQYLSSIMFQALLCQLKEEEKIEVRNKEPITLPSLHEMLMGNTYIFQEPRVIFFFSI